MVLDGGGGEQFGWEGCGRGLGWYDGGDLEMLRCERQKWEI